MSLSYRHFDSHQPFHVAVMGSPPYPPRTLTKPAEHLLTYLRRRARELPSPLFFPSLVHLSLMSHMKLAECQSALQELRFTEWVQQSEVTPADHGGDV